MRDDRYAQQQTTSKEEDITRFMLVLSCCRGVIGSKKSACIEDCQINYSKNWYAATQICAPTLSASRKKLKLVPAGNFHRRLPE